MTALYTPEILALAVELADFPRLDRPGSTGEARSRTCGGALTVDIQQGPDERIERVGLAVSACAIGQSAAAIFARSAAGRTPDEIASARDDIARWLEKGGALPDWPGIDTLERARDYPGRHGAILLAWNAARDALCKAPASR